MATVDIPGPWPHTALEGRVLRLDGDAFTVEPHRDWDHFNDPRLRETLAAWGLLTPEAVPCWNRWKVARSRVLGVAFDHAWALPAWARARADAGAPLTVVHLDRHTDCGAPLLLLDVAGTMRDCLTGGIVRGDAPSSFEAAIASGAIGIGGFVAPAVAAGLVERMVHVLPSRTPLPEERARTLQISAGDPHPRRPDLRWMTASLDEEAATALHRAGYLVAHAGAVPVDLPGPLALDVDLDYAANRLRGEPDWQDAPGPEMSDAEFAADVATVLDRLDADRLVCVTVGASPRYCPSERWRPLLEALSQVLAERLGASLEGLFPWSPPVVRG